MRIYRFRVMLVDKSEAVRDIEIGSEQTFLEFHQAILDAFGFKGEEMASFYVSDEEWNYGNEIPLADMGLAEDGAKTPILMSEMLISDHLRSTNQRYIYVYDFMSMWNFMVELIKASDPEEGTEYPRVVLSVNTPPSEFARVDELVRSPDASPFADLDDPEEDLGHENLDDLGEEYQ